ncbi:hypothetical protein QBC40DRAFT_312493 [Triangularia verruculosa]|uniref:Uncharacterized protein n=1 Tax=Triangularia verruculosa TaxID=2587418 RepID=A0AAN7ARR1_9PEZI|nr:hypothetical protein QBC40DRAFT_312493 [Triangularia verruculosa]
MSSLEQLFEKLLGLSKNRSRSDVTFRSAETGFHDLVELLRNISRLVKAAEISSQTEPADDTLYYAAEATRAAANAADAAAEAANAATRATSIAPANRVAKHALTAAFRAACLLADRFQQESSQLTSFYQFLFHDRQLQLPMPIFTQLPLIGQRIITVTASSLWDTSVGLLSRLNSDHADLSVLQTLLKLYREGNASLLSSLRQFLLKSHLFCNMNVLRRAAASEGCVLVELGLTHDASLRARNIEKRLKLDLFRGENTRKLGGFREDESPRPEHFRDDELQLVPVGTHSADDGDDGDIQVVSGKVQEGVDDDDFLTFPGRLNDVPLKPLIDTGGGCNLVKLEWLRRNGIHVDENAPGEHSLLMADGSESKKCPSIKARWSFDGRNKVWVDVEFVVVEDYQYDALIGLAFLKLSQTIHNSAGRLVFPEFKGIHAKKKGAIPLYNFKTNNSAPVGSRREKDSRQRQKGTSFIKKTTWALYDGKEFEKLVVQIIGFVDELEKLVPVEEVCRKLAEQEVATVVDKESLPSLKAAAKDLDQLLVDAIIRNSEKDTGADQYSAEEIEATETADVQIGSSYGGEAFLRNSSFVFRKTKNSVGRIMAGGSSRVQIGNRYGVK